MPPDAGIVAAHRRLAAAGRWERRGRVALAVLLIAACPLALTRMITDRGSDFPEFHQAGRQAIAHAPRPENPVLLYYLPSVDVAWGMLGAMPLWLAACAWYGFSCLSFWGLLAATRRYVLAEFPHAYARLGAVAAGLMAAPLAIDQFCLGGFHVLMLWLVVAGLGRASRGRWASGGALLGVAVWLKLLPLLAVGYLAWKRRFGACVAALAVAGGVHAILSLAAMGPQGAWQSTGDWWLSSPSRVTRDLLGKREGVLEQRDNNQSLPAVLRRVLSDMGRDGDPPIVAPSLAALSPGQLRGIYLGAMGALAGAGAVFTRRHWRRTSNEQWGAELALVAAATIWFSPVVWSYHFTAAAPAMALVLARAMRAWRKALAWFVVAAWAMLLALLGWRAACGFGQALWLTLALGAAVVWTTPRAPAAGPGRTVRRRSHDPSTQ